MCSFFQEITSISCGSSRVLKMSTLTPKGSKYSRYGRDSPNFFDKILSLEPSDANKLNLSMDSRGCGTGPPVYRQIILVHLQSEHS